MSKGDLMNFEEEPELELAVNHEDRHAPYFQLYLGNRKPQSGPFRMQCFLDRTGLTQFIFSPGGSFLRGSPLWERGRLVAGGSISHRSQFLLFSQILLINRLSFRKWKLLLIPGWHSRDVKYLFSGNKSKSEHHHSPQAKSHEKYWTSVYNRCACSI